jgi:hypothetical protein
LRRALNKTLPDHVGIIRGRYLRALLEGEKTIESRLSRTRRAPWGMVELGQRVVLVAPESRLAAWCVVSRVYSVSNLTPGGVDRLRAQFGALVGAPDAYWDGRRDARYATLLWFSACEVCGVFPAYRRWPGYKPMRGWHVILPRAGRGSQKGKMMPA